MDTREAANRAAAQTLRDMADHARQIRAAAPIQVFQDGMRADATAPAATTKQVDAWDHQAQDAGY